jgi:acyl carrier protein
MSSLSHEEATRIVIESITQIAPDVEDELRELDPGIDLWEALDLDSMDHVNVMTAVSDRTGVEVAERDYPSLRSVEALAQHLVKAGP